MKKYILVIVGVLLLINDIHGNFTYTGGNVSWNVGYIIGSLMMYLFSGILIYTGFQDFKKKD